MLTIYVSNCSKIVQYHRYFYQSPLVGDLVDMGERVLVIRARSWAPDGSLELHAMDFYTDSSISHFAKPYGTSILQGLAYLAILLVAFFGLWLAQGDLFSVTEDDAREAGTHQQNICQSYCEGARDVDMHTSLVEIRVHFGGSRVDDFTCICSPEDIVDTD
jgi:hypothetical protein